MRALKNHPDLVDRIKYTQRGVVTEDLVACLLYTSDAADERSSVDLGGRRIIKKHTRMSTVRWSEIKLKYNFDALEVEVRCIR